MSISGLSLELEWLSYHHLHPVILLGNSRINSKHHPFGIKPNAETSIPLHIIMQFAQIPPRRNPAEFNKRYKLNPLYTKTFL